jgi:hypothetical protein
MLFVLGVGLAVALGAVNVEMAAVRAPWSEGVPKSVIVFGGSDQAASPVKPRVIMCMRNRLFNATEAPRRPNAEGTRSRS